MQFKMSRSLFLGVIPAALLAVGCAGSSGSRARTFLQTNLVSDTAGVAAMTDANLKNAWGISFSPSGPFWISANGTGVSVVYDGTGATQLAPVVIPAAGGATNGPVTGQVYNGTTDFAIGGSGASVFIFDNEDGVLSAWNGGAGASVVSDQSATGAVYKGLAMASTGGANFLYAANFNAGTVDVFDKNFAKTSSFTDPNAPAGFAPFGIRNIGGQLFVTFAKQNAAKHDDVKGPGNGYVDIFDPNGTLVKRLISQGALNSPWGIAQAPAGFGHVGNALLIGNFGDGRINAYDISTGQFMETLNGGSGQPLVIDGLWALTFGNGGSGGDPNKLYFTAGPNGEADGLFGYLASS